jgi:hypothetical protein
MRKVTEDFIGTCQACFGEYKVNETSKLIVFHGYQRPGNGYTVGECPGTAHAPFEYDTALTVRIIGQHRERVAYAKGHLDRLRNGLIKKLVRHWKVWDKAGNSTDMSEEVVPGHKEWDKTLKGAIARTEGDEIYHTRVADYLQAMVDAWKRMPIVGIDVPATGKSRALRKAYDPAEADAAEARAAEQAKRDAKPGKLRVMFYREVAAKLSYAEAGGTEDAWRKQYDLHEEAYAKWVATLKQWCKANFVGKTVVRTEYDFNLPRGIKKDRGQNGIDHEVATALLPWDYRDWIKDRFPDAILKVDAKKEVEYVVLLEEGTI